MLVPHQVEVFNKIMGVKRRLAERKLWRHGETLFHNFSRYPETGKYKDRLLSVLERGLLAPAHVRDGSVTSDLAGHFTVKGTDIPYDSVIFLHQFSRDLSLPYLISHDEVSILINPEVEVQTQDQMGDGWPHISLDEVYSLEPIPPERFIAIYAPKHYLGEQAVKAALEIHDIPAFGT